jgi:hypothetical protein
MEKQFKLDEANSRMLAYCFGWPIGKKPEFIFTQEHDGQLYGEYDAGLDYNIDGYTFEWEFKITNPRI